MYRILAFHSRYHILPSRMLHRIVIRIVTSFSLLDVRCSAPCTILLWARFATAHHTRSLFSFTARSGLENRIYSQLLRRTYTPTSPFSVRPRRVLLGQAFASAIYRTVRN